MRAARAWRRSSAATRTTVSVCTAAADRSHSRERLFIQSSGGARQTKDGPAMSTQTTTTQLYLRE